jgi:hypothetical protein
MRLRFGASDGGNAGCKEDWVLRPSLKSTMEVTHQR